MALRFCRYQHSKSLERELRSTAAVFLKMNNGESHKPEEVSLAPQENHPSTESKKETAQAFWRKVSQKHTRLFRWVKRGIILASLGVGLWLALPLIKKLLPEGYSAFALILAVGIVALIVFSVWALWFIPRWQVASIKKRKETSLLNAEGTPLQVLADPSPDEKFSLENEARKTLAQIIGGVFVLLGLFFTGENLRVTQENADKTLKIADRGQVAERFTKAITQLGDKQIEIRLGGIYALEKIAKDYPNDYHWTVMEVLTAFVREKAPSNSTSASENQIASEESSTQDNRSSKMNEVNENSNHIIMIKPPRDIQTILTVIGRRSYTEEEGKDEYLDLSNTDLRGMDLYRANLSMAVFYGADLRGADLLEANLGRVTLNAANLSGAFLSEANLSGAILIRANLRKAFLIESNLSRALLRRADLSGADLSGANLSGANLNGAILLQCKNLTWGQIDSAYITEDTKLPPEFETQKQEKLKRQREQPQKPLEELKQP